MKSGCSKRLAERAPENSISAQKGSVANKIADFITFLKKINSHLHWEAKLNSQSLLREGACCDALSNGQGQAWILWRMSSPWTNTRHSKRLWGEDTSPMRLITLQDFQLHACFFFPPASFRENLDNDMTKLQSIKQLWVPCSVQATFVYVLNTLNFPANERPADSGTHVQTVMHVCA